MTKYSDLLADWLAQLGYTHCFLGNGGYIMHLVESCSRRFTCVPVVHEVAAGIAAEYFNEVHLGGKAFALVTGGPGLTNILTAMAGAYLESRELLVIGGQAKTADLAHGQVRQRGIQELDGIALAAPVTVRTARLDAPIDRSAFAALEASGRAGRRGPVFLEVPLDIQGACVEEAVFSTAPAPALPARPSAAAQAAERIAGRLRSAERPVLLLGGGIARATASALLPSLATLGVPLMCTWNAADRIPANHPLYFGRPNTWGQRYANVLLQQADVLVALGTRLGLQQTGFNWQQFLPVGEALLVDLDPRELEKGHPALAMRFCEDANAVLEALCSSQLPSYANWLAFCRMVEQTLPLADPANRTAEGYLCPYRFVQELSELAGEDDLILPCSSGAAFTVMMQAFAQKAGQRIVTNKGLASMGYGLSGAIGAAFAGANTGRRTILVEGDGGFLQNMQELGTVAVNRLPLKIFLFDNRGYASIRLSASRYFHGHYVGCDASSGLGMPHWEPLFAAFGIHVMRCGPGFAANPSFQRHFQAPGPAAFLVDIDPEQTYYPKIESRVTRSGGMESNPLHRLSPDLPPEVAARVFPYLPPPP